MPLHRDSSEYVIGTFQTELHVNNLRMVAPNQVCRSHNSRAAWKAFVDLLAKCIPNENDCAELIRRAWTGASCDVEHNDAQNAVLHQRELGLNRELREQVYLPQRGDDPRGAPDSARTSWKAAYEAAFAAQVTFLAQRDQARQERDVAVAERKKAEESEGILERALEQGAAQLDGLRKRAKDAEQSRDAFERDKYAAAAKQVDAEAKVTRLEHRIKHLEGLDFYRIPPKHRGPSDPGETWEQGCRYEHARYLLLWERLRETRAKFINTAEQITLAHPVPPAAATHADPNGEGKLRWVPDEGEFRRG